MTHAYGHKREFLREVDLDRKGLFNENNLIYTIKDEHGAPVGFAARDLFYEEKKREYDTKVLEIRTKDEKQQKKMIAELYQPRKYNNSAESGEINGETRPKNRIFKKGSRLFNFDLAKKATPPLEVFEGQPDCVTAYAAGMRNTCAIGSTAFTEDHLELILNSEPPIKHIVFTLDADEAGAKGTNRFVNLLEEKLGGHPGLRVEIRVMPEGSDDPDRFIRSQGIKAFRALPKEDLFSWRLKQAVERGEDPIEVANHAIGLIINETNVLYRREMARKLARVTVQAEEVIWDEVLRRVDVDKALVNQEKAAITNRMMRELQKHPERAADLIAQASTQMELVEKQRVGYDIHAVAQAYEQTYERAEKNDSRIGFATGFPIFDDRMRGIPLFEKFISVPGKPNVGKSTIFDNLAWRVAELNRNALVLFHTADDSLYERHSRLMASKFCVPSEVFEVPKVYLEHPEIAQQKFGIQDFQEIYIRAKAWFYDLMEAEKLIVADINLIAPTFPALERWVADVRKRFPDKNILVLEDNFHLLELPGYDAGEAKVAASSHFIKRICTNYQVTVVASMEITKADLAPGKRPVMAALKGSSAIPYDINANWVIHNDMADRMDQTELYWEDPNDQEQEQGPGGEQVSVNKRKPILEVCCDKNKISGFKGTTFFRMWPESGHLEECSSEEQLALRQKVRVRPRG
ncbi:MAG TPA: toprim domain-containing protein [Terriglobales bacterium]|nr:toprim domain-containing protein [Terriglobales bacterium]